MEHHDLDIYPIPREKTALYINEPCFEKKCIHRSGPIIRSTSANTVCQERIMIHR